jgi:hypothetical protein
MHHRWKCSRQSSDSHYQVIYISWEHKPCPRNSSSSQLEGLIIPQKHTHTLSRRLLQQRAKPNIRRSGRSRSWLPTQRYRAIRISLSSSVRLYFLIWTLSASYACRFLCSQKETKLLQLLTHFPSFYILAIPDQLCILLHTESFLHQTLHQITQLLPSS